ncbi:MAG: hypothetical protein QGH39_07085 [Candidatus Thermoplasmatota archaeon]|jgi:hypothetical protein|nr:hypothetical protein [Candidatus Thermoplasmatota archaeon]MDP7265308.1 hypothetical protein [Candidatus Thermoplasmatota archaeon]
MKKMMAITVLVILLVSSVLAYAPDEEGSYYIIDDLPEVSMTNEGWESGSRADEEEAQDNHTEQNSFGGS